MGGMLGSLARYGLSLAAQHVSFSFPLGTLWSNLAGCFIIGLVAGATASLGGVAPSTRLFLATGFCGGFTTLSSFVYELAQLLRDNELLYAAGYFTGTLFGSFAAFYGGTLFIRLLIRT
jgi:CrcB protein